MICEIPNVALWDAAGNCFNLDETEELSKIHYAFFCSSFFFPLLRQDGEVAVTHFTLNKIRLSVSE